MSFGECIMNRQKDERRNPSHGILIIGGLSLVLWAVIGVIAWQIFS
jgi:hypothetical protein